MSSRTSPMLDLSDVSNALRKSITIQSLSQASRNATRQECEEEIRDLEKQISRIRFQMTALEKSHGCLPFLQEISLQCRDGALSDIMSVEAMQSEGMDHGGRDSQGSERVTFSLRGRKSDRSALSNLVVLPDGG